MFCFVDYRISDIEVSNLKNLNLEIIKIPKCDLVYNAINGHVDIQMAILDKEKSLILLQKDIPKAFLEHLDSLNISYILSENSLEKDYPNNIFLNALITNTFLLHNLNFTDSKLLKYFSNLSFLDTKQGYTNCSVLKVSDTAFITSDTKIYESLLNEGFHVLKVPPGDILLEDFDYGFIGGVGGLVNPHTMVFFGSLNYYKHGAEIKEFLMNHNVTPIFLKDGPLTDRGSIFTL
ncbi:MAG: DUF6873 family GME fold protein [Clostridium sp.]|uniref:DUF6873 family GME fold protein n=1 Tax=Clostridium sp. TaxID=1506 RepID=UPI003F3EA9BD